MINRIEFNALSMRNFMSYGNNVTTIQLNHPGTTFVVGKDIDNTTNGTGSNGVGKTTCLNAIVYALYNRAITDDVTVDNLVNNINKKNMEVTLDFSIGNDCYRIIRARKMKSGPSGNYVRFYHKEGDFDFTDQHDMSKGHSVYDTDADIESHIGMKFDVFVRIVVFSAMKESFFNLPLRSHGTSKKSNQIDFIEELFGLTDLSLTAERLKQQMKETNREITAEQMNIDFLTRERERYETQLESAQRRVTRWDHDNAASIQQMEHAIEEFGSIDFDVELELHERRRLVKQQLNDLTSKQQAVTNTIKGLLKRDKQAKQEQAALHDSKCPYCNQSMVDTDHKLGECDKTIVKIEEELDAAYQQLEELTSEIEALDVELKAIVTTFKTASAAMETKSTVANGKNEIERLKSSANPFIEPLQELQQSPIAAPDFTKINELKRLAEHQDFLYKLLTKKDSFVRKNLLNRNLPFLNAKLQEYLLDLGLTHKVEFTHELTAKITQFGRELPFGNLSAGQKARVNIALSLAFRSVLQSMHMPISLCMFDEVLDVGLNTAGAMMTVRLLKKIAKAENASIFVISHKEEIDTSFDRVMQIQLSKGFSYVFTEDMGPALTNN